MPVWALLLFQLNHWQLSIIALFHELRWKMNLVPTNLDLSIGIVRRSYSIQRAFYCFLWQNETAQFEKQYFFHVNTSRRIITIFFSIYIFFSVLTEQEDHKQYLLHIVEEHWKQFPSASKSAIIKELILW